MQIRYSGEAFETLIDIVNYIEAMNTFGAGTRWLEKFEGFINESFKSPAVVKLCNNQTFYELKLRCLNFNDWVIAFSIEADKVHIEAILHSSRLID